MDRPLTAEATPARDSRGRPAGPDQNPLRADGSVDYRMWQKEWETTLQAARDELCIDKGFIIFLTGAALSSVLLFFFEVLLVLGGYWVHRRRLSRGAAGLAALAFIL